MLQDEASPRGSEEPGPGISRESSSVSGGTVEERIEGEQPSSGTRQPSVIPFSVQVQRYGCTLHPSSTHAATKEDIERE